MRRALHAHYRRVFRPGDRVLDVGCGTGIDAQFLTDLRIEVAGVDSSAAMIAQLRSRAPSVEAHVLDIADLSSLGPQQFDGLISAFAALNTIDLSRFAEDAARLVRPGGRLVLH